MRGMQAEERRSECGDHPMAAQAPQQVVNHQGRTCMHEQVHQMPAWRPQPEQLIAERQVDSEERAVVWQRDVRRPALETPDVAPEGVQEVAPRTELRIADDLFRIIVEKITAERVGKD